MMGKEPKLYLASEAPLGWDVYFDFVRPTMALEMSEEGLSEDEIRYRLALLDVDEHLRRDKPVLRWLARRLEFIPYVRKWLRYEDEYRNTYQWTSRFEATKLLDHD